MSADGPRGGRLALALSERCVALLLERGTIIGVTTAELAHAAGVSPRTFHRYLGSREDCVRPVLAAAISAMGSALLARPAEEPLNRALARAFAAAASGPHLARTLRLLPLLTETPAMRAVWAQALHDGEAALTPFIARRMGLDQPSSPRAAVLATVVLALVRRALVDAASEGIDPAPVFEEYLSTLDGGPLAAQGAPV
ncbi:MULTISPECIES: TetR/AcrR family transcriptional regulator [unclassified Rathayibacter]|uniref:TetR/AcrR family transcriptional regulator n=1 Tax=unclassified Rathayibacter TaxID=2609250 RepID=UPI00188C120C|nr:MULTISPECIES: TetR family transcriptional regulator [unclassified Rathayibacter]MBF4463414.1 TetR/AcrR family transcriptional regulator [Rathayibacter sp. VKM Ac-2879]MBF4504863.1 TetR/AcrR family transcriptional regulator [Rathayibacter sp. VKM Ac-2878]